MTRLAIALEDPRLEPYLHAVEAVQAQADTTDGFLWRDQYFATFDDPNPVGPDVLATISVWSTVEA